LPSLSLLVLTVLTKLSTTNISKIKSLRLAYSAMTKTASPTSVKDDAVVAKKAKIGTDAKSELLAKTHAYGKLILFGEHFVVYKVPALVGAVAAYTDCSIEVGDADDSTNEKETGVIEIIDNRPAVPNYKTKKAEEGKKAIDLVLNHFKIFGKGKKATLTFGGNLCCASGIGASAAQVVALARAVKETLPEFSELTEDQINAAGYEGEKGYHGTPSGIDNTAATFGGLLKFQRTDGEPIFEKKAIKEPIRIVYASTGITSSTTEVVGDVRAKKEADPAWFDDLLKKYCALATEGEKAVEDGDLTKLGELMNENHKLLQDLTVSCKELDTLVDAARKAGAIGAKMSGTGRGGLMLALTPTEEAQNVVAEALEKIAPQVWKTSFQ
jgi:mevalonate kinase